MKTPTDIARYRTNLQDEVNSAALYRTLADLEPQAHLAEVYRRLASGDESEQVQRREVAPVEIFEHQDQREFGRDRLQHFGQLPQHAFPRDARDLAL